MGANIERLRTDRDLSRAALASRAGMTPRYVARLEKGQARPTLKTIEALAVSLEVEPWRLVEDAPATA